MANALSARAVRICDLTFAYPEHEPLLEHVSLEVDAGAFCLVNGPTGCGKTTLLRLLKPELAPAGIKTGTIEVLGEQAADSRRSATDIGFIMQDPAAQIVCDTVWHEIAFGLENIGMAQSEMRRRVAEVAHFFGIEPLMHTSTDELSGGQQQLVNLAGVLALQPRLLVLDEPTASLDPDARRQFLYLLGRVHRELGITVIMSTHLPEEAEHLATQTFAIGPVTPAVPRAELDRRLAVRWNTFRRGLPVLSAHDVFVRYDRDAPWTLRGLDLTVCQGSVHAIVGGNGCGKSTLLKTLVGILRPQRGHVENTCHETQSYLPQDPKALLVCNTVADELDEWRERAGYGTDDIARMLERMGLSGLEAHHPFDLSGGQQQKLALAKVLLTRPQLLVLDEPTTGLDASGAAEIVTILRGIAERGCTVLLVTHDLDVAYAVADEVSLMFDGQIACTEPAREFFGHSLMYRPHERSRLFGMLLQREEAPMEAVDQPSLDVRASVEEAPLEQPRPRRLKGNAALEAIALAAVPAVLVIAGLCGFRQTALLSFTVVLAALGIFFASYETGEMHMREIMPTVVLAALAAAGRVLFAAVPSVKPISAVAIIAGVCLGRRSGFMVGALAALTSNFFFGQGAWTPWQMYAWGLVGYGAGALAQIGVFGHPDASGQGRKGMPALLVYGFVASVLYGWILNAWSIIGYLHTGLGFNLLAVYAASFPFDAAHGIATVAFLGALYLPWRRKLARIVRRYGIERGENR